MNMAKVIARLLPQSQAWLRQRGYITITTEGGKEVIQITEEGYRYLHSIGAYRNNSDAKDVDTFHD